MAFFPHNKVTLSLLIILVIVRQDCFLHIQFSSVQSLSHVWLFATPWIAAHQSSLSTSNSWSLLKLMPIELVMPSSHLILCCPLLLLPHTPPSIRVFSNESTPHYFIAKKYGILTQNCFTNHLSSLWWRGTRHKIGLCNLHVLTQASQFCPGLKNFLGHRNFRTKTKESQTSQSFQFSFDLIPKSPALKVVEGLFQDPS